MVYGAVLCAGEIREVLSRRFIATRRFRKGLDVDCSVQQRNGNLPTGQIIDLGKYLKWVGRNYTTQEGMKSLNKMFKHWRDKRHVTDPDVWKDGIVALGMCSRFN